MLQKETISFLKKIKANNNKDWFAKNKLQYETSKNDFETFVQKLIEGIRKFDKEIPDLEAKKTIFRIYRDVRFSKNKDPYKTNMGTYICKASKQEVNSTAGYYLHIEPGGKSFLAGGAYMPPSDWLNAIRSEIDYNGEVFKKIMVNKSFINTFKLEGEKLSRPPKGYDVNHPDIDLLKHKSFIAVHSISDDQIQRKDFLNYCLKVFKALHPFNEFLNKAKD